MAVRVVFYGVEHRGVDFEDATGWEVGESGNLLILGPEKPREPVTTMMGTQVGAAETPIVAEFAEGSWSYVQLT